MTRLSDLPPIRYLAIAFAMCMVSSVATAASLNLSPGYPDVGSGGTIGYSHDGSSGLFEVDDSGTFTITWNDGASLDFIGGATYDLNATFDSSGNFTGGTVSITGASLTANPLWAGPTILTATLTDFGFQGDGAAGVFEFKFDDAGGDMADFGHAGGIIISTFNLSGPGVTGVWDPGNDGQPDFFLNDFSGTASAVDSFIPVPGAAWLLGSALLGVAAVRRRAAGASRQNRIGHA